MSAYYNEFDPFAAAWLRELIKSGFIPEGDVDERSIVDVSPDDLKGYTQCHFFAGIGGWAFAARLAGIPDDFPLWTGSCPCQSFSTAGQKKGFDDERHLWPTFFKLIEARKPPIVAGEQVEAAIRFGWLDLVAGDLQRCGYAVGAAVLPAASIGAPHIRKRLYWGGVGVTPKSLPDSYSSRQSEFFANVAANASEPEDVQRQPSLFDVPLADTDGHGRAARQIQPKSCDSRTSESAGRDQSALENAAGDRLERFDQYQPATREGRTTVDGSGAAYGLADADLFGRRGRRTEGSNRESERLQIGCEKSLPLPSIFWEHCEWRAGIDGTIRPVEPQSFPLAYGVPARVGRLRGYGNAIVPQCAQVFLEELIAAAIEAG